MAYGKWILPLALITAGPVAAGAPAPADKQIASIDLGKPFATRSPWRFIATQAPDVDDPTWMNGEGGKVPGPIRLCLTKDGGRTCTPDLSRPMRLSSSEADMFDDAHELRSARIVWPRGPRGRTLFLLQVASLNSGDGDQRVGTRLMAYDRASDHFTAIFASATGHNNNQEIRYIADGALSGDVIVAEPAQKAPFGFWISVNRLTPAFTYKQVLRFRSATLYGDGNPLAVIDSEMPNIQQRLGLWRPGKPLPAPKSCVRPHLVKTELWCS